MSLEQNAKKLDEVAELLRRSRRILFITGAGISADSGLPTYRGVGGLYNHGRTEEGYTIEECLSGTMFRRRPEITWKHMLPLGLAIAAHRPNEAHRIIAKWEGRAEETGGKVVVLTQNVDGYHRAAGSRNVYEIHGSFETLFCPDCGWLERLHPETDLPERLEKLAGNLPPRCPNCGAVVRPRIVLFEEMLPFDQVENFQNEFADGNGFDLVFAVGTSAMFPYIVQPVRLAAALGRPTVEINPQESDLSREVRYHLPLRAAEALQDLDRRRG